MSGSNDTIFALSSGGLPSGVAIVRVSGPSAYSVGASLVDLPAPQKASLRTIRTRNGLVIDRGLILTFRGPASFTGEDCVEFHVHGGKAVVSALLDELASHANFRLAEQGEFSRRALENGKLDLVEIEGLADLLAAETEMQRQLAIEHASGGLSRLYQEWADSITRARALIEAELDFAEEEDIPGSVSDQAWDDITAVLESLSSHLAGASFGEILRDGLKVVITGPPNSGKSSFLNALSRRDVAIVTNVAGTTRDVLEVAMDLDGFAVRIYDTAGLRETKDLVEVEGVRRAREAISRADVVLSLAEIGSDAQKYFPDYSGRVVTLGTKSDLHTGRDGEYDVKVSSFTQAGFAELRVMLSSTLATLASGHSMSVPSRGRHRQLLTETSNSLRLALNGNVALDVRAELLRAAANSLGRITGHVDVEDLLDVIFSEFCIGK